MLAICHTFYSLKTGVRSPHDWAEAVAARGYSALAVADVNGLYGAVEFYRAVTETGLKPVIGTELVLGEGCSATLLATSSAGYRQLCKLLSAYHLKADFSLGRFLAESAVDELLFLTRSMYMAQSVQASVPPENMFLLPQGGAPGDLWNTRLVDLPQANIPDAWFIDYPADSEKFELLQRVRALAGDSVSVNPEHPGVVLPEAQDWLKDFPNTGIVEKILSRCQFELELGCPRLPRVKLPDGVTAGQKLRRECYEALPRKYSGERKHQAEIRLARELKAIIGNGFADYFLYVHEIVRFAQSRRIPVEVRGSAASSIVSYLLTFTHCCPLEHDLYFERFMNPGRRDCPDVDIDVADNRRDEVINFCYERWGAERVAMVATVLKYRHRSAVRDAGRVLGYAPSAVSDILEAQDSGRWKHPELFRVASLLVGLPRHVGVHCGGLVITPCPLTDLTPLRRSSKGVVITHFEKDQAEVIGLVKMDILGNSSLSVIEESRSALWERGVVFAEPGPRYDYKVNRVFATGDTLGVYQCESPGMRQLCRALKPRTVKQTAAALSLIRPGPAAAGMKDVFIRRQRGLEPVKYMHPRMADFLDKTYGLMLYQEDVMKVAVNLAGYTLADADCLRRAVKKRYSQGFSTEKNRFVFEKAAGQGMDVATAEELWQHVAQFASYSYCKAHASVYGRLAWLTARLKAHFPCEFYAAVLNWHKSIYPKRVFVWDAIRHGIPVLPPEINASGFHWTPTRRGVQAGLGIIQGLRHSVKQEIVKNRVQGLYRNLDDLRHRVSFRKNELERLILTGACYSLGSRKSLYLALRQSLNSHQQPLLFEDTAEIKLIGRELAELLWTGIPFRYHPVVGTREGICRAEDMNKYVKRDVWMLGILDAVKVTRTKSKAEGRHDSPEMSFVTLEDESGVFELLLFPETHALYSGCFCDVGPYLVHGKITCQWDSLILEVKSVEHRPESLEIDVRGEGVAC